MQGLRSRVWLKIKHIKTQDCVVIGYTRGEGNRENYFGSLLLAAFDPTNNKFRFVGHTGSGFDFIQLMKYTKCCRLCGWINAQLTIYPTPIETQPG